MDDKDNITDLDKLLGPKKSTVQLKDFGTVQIKSFNLEDTISAFKLLKTITNNKEFTIKLLHNQLETKIEFSEFQKISEEELKKLAKQYITDRPLIAKNFTESKDFFHDFRNAIDSYLKTSFTSIYSSLNSIYGFNNVYTGFNPIPINKNLVAFNKKAQKMTESIIKSYFDLNKINRLGNELAKSFALSSIQLNSWVKNLKLNSSIINNVITPQVKIWENWTQKNKTVFNNFNQNWRRFAETYNITVEEAINILKDYQWFITPSLPPKFIFEIVKIGRKIGNQRIPINNHFFEYYSSNNFVNLENLVNKWESDNIFRYKRIDIIKTCFSILKNNENNVNTSFVIIPTLIPQIDAIQTQIYEAKRIMSD